LSKLAEALHADADGMLKKIVAKVLAKYGGRLTEESAQAIEIELCCRCVGYMTSR